MTSRIRFVTGLAASAVLVIAASCGDDDGVRDVDSGVERDAGRDTGPPEMDAGTDAGPDEMDAGEDVDAEVETDAGPTPDATTPPVEVVDCATVEPDHTVNAVLPNFMPAALTVAEGDIVEFANTDVVPHTTTSGMGGGSPMPDGIWDEDLPVGASACIRFDTVGTYPYYCELHPTTMQAEITVE